MKIRSMTIEDYEVVYQLWLSTPGMGLNSLDDSRDGIKKYLNRNPNTCLVAEKENLIVGVIMCGHDGRRGYIYHTAVTAAERGNGIGGALVRAALSALEEEGINKAALVVFSNNETGNSFWEKYGFTLRGDLIYRNKTIKVSIRLNT